MIFADGLRMMSLVPMKPSEAQVFWAMMETLDSEEWRPFTKSKWADRLALERASVSKAAKSLVERGLVKANAGQYRLSLFLGWKGHPCDYLACAEARADEIEEALEWHASRAISNVDSEGDWYLSAERVGTINACVAERPTTAWEAEAFDDNSIDQIKAITQEIYDRQPRTMPQHDWFWFVRQWPDDMPIATIANIAEQCPDHLNAEQFLADAQMIHRRLQH